LRHTSSAPGALGNFATVDEVKQAVKDIVLAPTPAPGFGSEKGIVPAVHFFIQDKSGKSIVVEPVNHMLKVSDAPLGVITNAPTYDWHITNLANYINLSTTDVSSAKLGPLTLEAFGTGAGFAAYRATSRRRRASSAPRSSRSRRRRTPRPTTRCSRPSTS
jgi:penicillin V acylase-like amidase (Ntn superfamily)